MLKRKLVLILIAALARCLCADADEEAFAAALDRAGENRGELLKAVSAFEGEERTGMTFLIENMPERDLKSLSAEFLIENVEYAYRAWRQAPWRDAISEELFLNNILPYANLNERRDRWRKDFYQRFNALVADCASPGEAAARLNQSIFKQFGVVFSRQRPKADQSPYETVEAGMASCTGLSILLADACRAVGVPARVAGIPLWPDRSGNHSWVEVWDGGWHYTGAAEPYGAELDKAWFSAKAATAIPRHKQHSILAASFKRTSRHFPLVWDPSIKYVSAVDVTENYLPAGGGSNRGDRNGVAAFDREASLHALRQLREYLKEDGDCDDLARQPFAAVPLSSDHARTAAGMLWQDYAERERQAREQEMEARTIVVGGKKMPFFYSVNGEKPSNGRSLFISLHGGGGAPKAVNDQQWRNQQHLYKIEEGVYVAPRAPNDAWNMWFQGHIDAMFDRIIQNMILFEDVNPNRVYLMGYSAGGDGLYRMAPRMADRWAAAAMMAGHPGDASPLSLYNTPFTIHVGEKDAAYNRNLEARKFGEKLDKLEEKYPGGYKHWTEIYPGKGHWVDAGGASAIPWMAGFERNPFPKRIVWRQDRHKRFFWLATDDLAEGAVVRAEAKGQAIYLQFEDASAPILRLNDAICDLDRELRVFANGEEVFRGRPARLISTIANTIAERGDPASIFSAEIVLD